LNGGDWGWGMGDGGLGFGDWGLGPIPNPQSPIPNPQYINKFIYYNVKLENNNNKLNFNLLKF